MDNAVEWTHREVELESTGVLQEKGRAIASRNEQISRLRDDLDFERERQELARRDFLRARGERDGLEAQIETMSADFEAQKKALATFEENRKSADARRISLEEKVKELREAIGFRDEAAERMNVVRRTEAKELADGRAV